MTKIKKLTALILSISILFGFATTSVAADEEVLEDVSVTLDEEASEERIEDVYAAETAAAPSETAPEEPAVIGPTTPTRISVAVNGDPSTQKGITWYTNENTTSKVEIAGIDGNLVTKCTVTYDEVFEWEGKFVHKALISDLTPGTLYLFRVGNGTDFSKVGKFVTDNDDDKFNFVAIADVQAGNLDNFMKSARVVEAAFAKAPTAEFIVNMGDFTDDSTNEEWDYYDTAMGDINLSTTIVPVAGNHDGLGVEYWFNNMFNLDTSESVQVKDGVNYSFDYGNAHFAVLNTNDILSISIPQLKWLENDLNGTDKDWKIVCLHKSPYSLGKDAKWPDALYLQKSLTRVLDKCDVDLVMSGHDHQYLRTKPLKGNKVNNDGTVYVLSGTAGAKRYEVREFLAGHFMKTEWINALTIQKNGYGNFWDGQDWDQTNQAYIGGIFNTISVDGGKLTFNSYVLSDAPVDENGEEIAGGEQFVTLHDSFTLEKETGKNKITFTGDNTTSESEYNMYIVPSFMGLAAYAIIEWLPKFLIMVPALLKSVIVDDVF